MFYRPMPQAFQFDTDWSNWYSSVRTDRSGDCWLWVALRTLSGASQQW